METFGDRIKIAREKAGLSQTALAKETGVSREAVAQWENGSTKNIRPDNLFMVADVLGVSARWIATGKNDIDGYTISDALIERVASDLKGRFSEEWAKADSNQATVMIRLLLTIHQGGQNVSNPISTGEGRKRVR